MLLIPVAVQYISNMYQKTYRIIPDIEEVLWECCWTLGFSISSFGHCCSVADLQGMVGPCPRLVGPSQIPLGPCAWICCWVNVAYCLDLPSLCLVLGWKQGLTIRWHPKYKICTITHNFVVCREYSWYAIHISNMIGYQVKEKILDHLGMDSTSLLNGTEWTDHHLLKNIPLFGGDTNECCLTRYSKTSCRPTVQLKCVGMKKWK